MGLRDIGATLPPGFRFYPSDEELVCHYLYKKIANEDVLKGTLVEIDLHTCEPWQLPGYRTNRATTSGYWKATGKDRVVVDPKTGATVGMRKTLVFYMNRAPNGIKTGWIMHEFRLENPNIPPKEDWVLCRVFYKAKGDNSNQQYPQDMYHNTTHNVNAPNLDPSPILTTICQPSPCVHQNHPLITTNHHNYFGISPQHCNPQNTLQLPPDSALNESTGQMIISANNKCEDQYGFFYNMGFEDHVPSHNLQDMEYEDDDNDNGIVFYE